MTMCACAASPSVDSGGTNYQLPEWVVPLGGVDQATLIKMASDDADENVRYAAAGRIQNMDVLRRIADADEKKRSSSRLRTIVQVRNLLAESEVLQQDAWISLRVTHMSESYGGGGVQKTVYGETVTVVIVTGEKTVLAYGVWQSTFPRNVAVPAGIGSFAPDFQPADPNLIELIEDVCRSQHYAPPQIREALIKIAAKDKGAWQGAIHKLWGSDTYQGDGRDTALHWAARMGHKDIAEILLANGADVNARDRDGGTPLHSAATAADTAMTELLLAHGAEVDARKSNGITPLFLAVLSPYPQKRATEAVLVAHGANIHARAAGSSPLEEDRSLANLVRQLRGSKPAKRH
jgi:hypothetical protein